MQQVLYQAAGAGEVHRAGQRQPAAGRGAEGRQLAVRTDQRPLGIGAQGAGGAQAGGEQAGADVAGADGGEHVVAAAAGDPRVGSQAEGGGASGAQVADAGAGLDQLRQRRRQASARLDQLQHVAGPGAPAHVEVAAAGGVARFAQTRPVSQWLR